MAAKQWDMIRLFESINKTKISENSILKEEIDTLRDSNLEASVAIGEARDANAPIERIADFFSHYKLDISKFDENIVRQVYKVWDEEADYEGLSDMEENPDGTLSIELDGMYGKHWMSFKSQEEFQKYYDDRILGDARYAFEELYKRYEALDRKKKDQQAFEKTTTNTLGNTHGDVLSALKAKMSEAISGTRTVEAKYLKAGDHIVGLGKGLKVIRGASAGTRTPSGKIDLVVEYPDGKQYLKIWNKNTKIQIYDKPVEPQISPEAGIEEATNSPSDFVIKVYGRGNLAGKLAAFPQNEKAKNLIGNEDVFATKAEDLEKVEKFLADNRMHYEIIHLN